MAKTRTNDEQDQVVVDAEGRFQHIEQPTDAQVVEAKKAARERKAIFEHRQRGAEARAGALPRSLTAAFAAGAANLMLAQVLQGELVPTTAKEALDVAKAANEIYRSVAGAETSKTLTPAELAKKQDDVRVLVDVLAQRAKAVNAQLGGAVPAGTPVDVAEPREPEREPVEYEDDDEPVHTPDTD